MDPTPRLRLPAAVGVQISADFPIHPGILLEWKKVPDSRGRWIWWALVVLAKESAVHPAIPFRVECEWVPPEYLVGLPVDLRWSGRTSHS